MDDGEIAEALTAIRKIQATLTEGDGTTGIKIGKNVSGVFIGDNVFDGLDTAIEVDEGGKSIVVWRNKISAGLKGETIAKLGELQQIMEEMKPETGTPTNLRIIFEWFRRNAEPIFTSLNAVDSIRKLIQGH